MSLPEFTPEQLNAARDLISSYETSMNDPYRNDGCENEDEARDDDECRAITLIENLKMTLGVDHIRARKFFDDNI